MVNDIRVRDGQDHARLPNAQPGIEPVLQVDDLRLSIHANLGIHAMVGCQGNHTAHVVQLLHVAVHHGVKAVGALRPRRVFVLDVIRGGEIHHIGLLVSHEPDTGGKHKFRQIRAVHTGQGLAHLAQHPLDAVLGKRGFIGFFS